MWQEVQAIFRYSFEAGFIISIAVLTIYVYNHKTGVDYLKAVLMVGGVHTAIFATTVCVRVVFKQVCLESQTEMLFLFFGAMGVIWNIVKNISRTLSKSQPHHP